MQGKTILRDLVLPVAMMAGFGTLFWGIRGTGGYGGSMGALFAGTGWAVLWYFLSNNDNNHNFDHGETGGARPLATRWAVLAIGAGIMIGGFHGYGQFISWIEGSWRIIGGTPGVTIEVDPAWGFLGLLQCGLSWGGTAGVMLGWAARGDGNRNAARRAWIVRGVLGVSGAIAGLVIALVFPGLLVPHYGSSYFADLGSCLQCTRAIDTAISSAVQFGLFVGLLTAEISLKNWRGVTTAMITGAGFGIAFVVAAGWFFTSIPWSWKCWEMSIGAIGGASIGITFFVANRRVARGSASPALFPVHESMFHPPTRHEIVFGHNLLLVLGMSTAVYNGMKPGDGFAGNFFSSDPVATDVVMGITYLVIVATWALFAISIANQHARRPFMKPWFGQPLRQVIAVQAVLAVIGIMATLVPAVPLPDSTAAIMATYLAGIAIGGTSIACVAIMDRALPR